MARVLLVGDRPVVLTGLRSHLAHEDLSMAEVTPPPSRTLEPITDLRPDVVLLDSSATREAFLLCYRLKQLARRQPVVLHLTDPTPQLLVAAWVAGASGLASPATSRAALVETLCLAASGRRALPRPPIAAVRAAGRQLAPVDLSIFGMRMHDVPSDEISSALRLDPLAVDRRIRSLVEFLSRDQGPDTSLTRRPEAEPLAGMASCAVV